MRGIGGLGLGDLVARFRDIGLGTPSWRSGWEATSNMKWKPALCRGSWLPSEFICWQVARNERAHGKGLETAILVVI